MCCNKKQCDITYTDFSDEVKTPSIYIADKLDACEYLVKVSLFFDSMYVDTNGSTYLEDSIFYLRLKKPKSEYFEFFDLTKSQGEKYKIEFKLKEFERERAQLEMVVDNIFVQDSISFHQFRLKNGYYYEDSSFDAVFFVTKNDFVIGSYISSFHDSIESVISPSGNILRDKIDYSKKRFGKLL